VRARQAFTVAALRRAVKGVKEAGIEVSRVEIEPNGKIVVITESDAATRGESDLDKWMTGRARKA